MERLVDALKLEFAVRPRFGKRFLQQLKKSVGDVIFLYSDGTGVGILLLNKMGDFFRGKTVGIRLVIPVTNYITFPALVQDGFMPFIRT